LPTCGRSAIQRTTARVPGPRGLTIPCVSGQPQAPDSLLDEMQAQNLSSAYPRADQERQGQPEQNHDHDGDGQERNIKKKGADAAREQHSAQDQEAEDGDGLTE